MVAFFFYQAPGSMTLTPIYSSPCSTVYAGNTEVLNLINNPDAYCLDTSGVNTMTDYTFGQPGFAPYSFVLNVATCSSMLGSWYQKTHTVPPA